MQRIELAEISGFNGAFPEAVPLSLYIHIPWCVRKCPYCDFNSHTPSGELPEGRYIDALLRDLEQDLPRMWGRRISSVFIGGGTPSIFSPESIARLLSGLRARLSLTPGLEITMEANPGTAESGRFSGYRAAGVNRLSIGVQSFNDHLLERIGRIHGRREAIQAVEMAYGAGFDAVNLDLMFGLPGQTVREAVDDIRLALSLEPAHLSHYQLTLEPNTGFFARPPELPAGDAICEMQDGCESEISGGGYEHYEISAYARPGARCAHNLNYWRFGDYLGIGVGAHGKLSQVSPAGVARYCKLRRPDTYMAATASFISEESRPAPEDLVIEFMMNGLRLAEGVPASLFSARTGLATEVLAEGLLKAREQGLLEESDTRFQATPRGRRYLNELLGLFTP